MIGPNTEKYSLLVFLVSLAVLVATYFTKDRLPDPGYYDITTLSPPLQEPTSQQAFTIIVNNQHYIIRPRYEYQLNGVIVTYNNSDGFGDIWHHRRWNDFINLRDLCVVWGDNVKSGVYKKVAFSSDSWTCWVAWADRQTGDLFKGNALSNNHLLTDSLAIKKTLMQAEIGDQIRLRGVLAEYANQDAHFRRGTSISRDDTGNGACETIFLSQFSIVKKANPGLRMLYTLALWSTALSFITWVLMLFIAPYKKYGR